MSIAVPPLLRSTLLPSPELSVSAFLQFPLPAQDQTQHSDISTFWCTGNPNINEIRLEDLKDLPIPSSKVLSSLLNHVGVSKAICYAHLPTVKHLRYPLWILTYWIEVSHLRRYVRQPWANAEMFLSKQQTRYKSPNLRKLCDTTQMILLGLPWAGNVSGFSESEP
jgi:hypothetical protein